MNSPDDIALMLPEDHIEAGDQALKHAISWGTTPSLRAHQGAVANAHYSAAIAKLLMRAEEPIEQTVIVGGVFETDAPVQNAEVVEDPNA